MKHVWIIGSGGMLGSALRRSFLGRSISVFEVSEAFEWSNLERLSTQLKVSTDKFFGGVTSNDNWEIYWACGVGTMGSSAKEMNVENQCFIIFLDAIKMKLAEAKSCGVIAYASSAGALYAGCTDFEITEETEVSIINEYGRSKLFQETHLVEMAVECNKVKILIARFSTIYGPGQGKSKSQGLITHIAHSALRNNPVNIFVPLATARDYIHVDDAAAHFIHLAHELNGRKDIFFVIKIIAYERSISIAEIISTFNRLMKKKVGILGCRSDLTSQYTSRVSYRSKISINNTSNPRRRPVIEGFHSTLEFERLQYIGRGHTL